MKKSIVFAGLVLVCGVLVFWFYGRPAYRNHKENRSLDQTKRFLARGDLRSASLSARQTLQANPRNVEACRIIAELAERSRSPHLLDWRRRIVELAPTTENKLLLASAALRVQGPPYPLAAQTLDELAPLAKDVPAYHVVAAELALKLHKISEAETRFLEASRLEPANELHQLNLAVLRLQSTNQAAAADARATLERLRSRPKVRAVALRWLVAQTLQTREWSAAEAFSQELLHDPQASLDDRLQHLNILQQAKKPEFDACLASLQINSLTNAAEVYGISTWMAGHGLAEDALRWLTNCPARLQLEQPVPLAFVDCYIARKDWNGLEAFLQPGKWGDLEFLRQAFLSRAASEQKESLGADVRWRSAVREAGDRLGPIMTLLGLANSWGREKAKEELLWQIAQRFPRERWAVLELGRLYQSTGNTRGLNKISALSASYNSKDFQAQNNLVTTSLLLRLDVPRAHELAKDIYLKHGELPVIASTYALSLFIQGRTREALDIFEKLKPEDLESPPIALYYGVFLAANGETNKAIKFLDIAKVNTASFLPEERALMAQAGERPLQ